MLLSTRTSDTNAKNVCAWKEMGEGKAKTVNAETLTKRSVRVGGAVAGIFFI